MIQKLHSWLVIAEESLYMCTRKMFILERNKADIKNKLDKDIVHPAEKYRNEINEVN